MLMTATLDTSLQLLQQRGILKEVQPGSLPGQIMKLGGHNSFAGINVSVLSCCDGHQFMDVTRHTFECCAAAKAEAQQEMGLAGLGEDCFHWRTENGGPFALSVPELQSRTYVDADEVSHEVRVDYDILGSMKEGLRLKNLNVVLLIGHCICGKMAPLVNRFEDYISYMALAKKRVMREFGLPKEQVIAQLQCYRSENKRRTYHVDYSEASALQIAA